MEKESLYCKVCGGCGEDGCCSALKCRQSIDGAYCEVYLAELKYTYLMWNDIQHLLKDDPLSKEALNRIMQENLNKAFRNEQ